MIFYNVPESSCFVSDYDDDTISTSLTDDEKLAEIDNPLVMTELSLDHHEILSQRIWKQHNLNLFFTANQIVSIYTKANGKPLSDLMKLPLVIGYPQPNTLGTRWIYLDPIMFVVDCQHWRIAKWLYGFSIINLNYRIPAGGSILKSMMTLEWQEFVAWLNETAAPAIVAFQLEMIRTVYRKTIY